MGRVKITETSLRDGHQSLMATRMTTAEMLPIIEDAQILRNIIYSGVWTRFEQIRAKRNEQENKVDRSV